MKLSRWIIEWTLPFWVYYHDHAIVIMMYKKLWWVFIIYDLKQSLKKPFSCSTYAQGRFQQMIKGFRAATTTAAFVPLLWCVSIVCKDGNLSVIFFISSKKGFCDFVCLRWKFLGFKEKVSFFWVDLNNWAQWFGNEKKRVKEIENNRNENNI